MRQIILIISIFAIYLVVKAQEKKADPTIPIEKEIKVTITSVDSTTFVHYNRYFFDYKKGKTASFICEKENRTFEMGEIKLVFCRVNSFRTNDSLNFRSNRALLGSFYSDGELMINFDEFSAKPTLEICE